MKYFFFILALFIPAFTIYAGDFLKNSEFYNKEFIKVPVCSNYDANIKYYDALAESYDNDIDNTDRWLEASKNGHSFELKKRKCIKEKAEKKDPVLLKQMKSICSKGGGIPLKKFIFDKTYLSGITGDGVFINISGEDVELGISTKVYFGRLISSLCDCNSKGYDLFAPAKLACYKLD